MWPLTPWWLADKDGSSTGKRSGQIRIIVGRATFFTFSMVSDSTTQLPSTAAAGELPFLSISIPTYNRAELLDQCLARLANELRDSKQLVELIISNNASTDATREVAQRFKEYFSRFRYVENETNIGADGNIAQAFRLAAGQYVWVFSDDDSLLPGYLATLLEILAAQQPGVLHLTSVWHNGLTVPDYGAPVPLQYATYSGLEFIRRVHHWTTFITANIIHKSLVADLPLTYAFPDTNLVQLGWTLPAIFKATQNVVVSTPVIAAKSESSGNYKAFQTFATNFSRILQRLAQAKEIPVEASHIISLAMLRGEFPRMLMANDFGKSGKYVAEPIFRTLLANYWQYPAFWRHIALAYLKRPVRPVWHRAKSLLR
ncbi:MAG: glycosyltransferase family 2 protein [Hymenobacter sp.]|nr:MAG: glycosyltransferase family 2 protein [Hymenobacter sp.]